MISDETLTEWEQSHAIVDDAFGVAASRQVVALIAELRELRLAGECTADDRDLYMARAEEFEAKFRELETERWQVVATRNANVMRADAAEKKLRSHEHFAEQVKEALNSPDHTHYVGDALNAIGDAWLHLRAVLGEGS